MAEPGGFTSPYTTFDELFGHWKEIEQTAVPFRAVLLSTEVAGLDKKVTDFVFKNLDELNDMSGNACWMFTPIPKRFRGLLFTRNH